MTTIKATRPARRTFGSIFGSLGSFDEVRQAQTLLIAHVNDALQGVVTVEPPMEPGSLEFHQLTPCTPSPLPVRSFLLRLFPRPYRDGYCLSSELKLPNNRWDPAHNFKGGRSSRTHIDLLVARIREQAAVEVKDAQAKASEQSKIKAHEHWVRSALAGRAYQLVQEDESSPYRPRTVVGGLGGKIEAHPDGVSVFGLLTLLSEAEVRLYFDFVEECLHLRSGEPDCAEYCALGEREAAALRPSLPAKSEPVRKPRRALQVFADDGARGGVP